MITKIFVRTFTNMPKNFHHHPIIITKIFVRTFTNIPKLPTIIIPSSSPITIPGIVSGSGIKFTGHFKKKLRYAPTPVTVMVKNVTGQKVTEKCYGTIILYIVD